MFQPYMSVVSDCWKSETSDHRGQGQGPVSLAPAVTAAVIIYVRDGDSKRRTDTVRILTFASPLLPKHITASWLHEGHRTGHTPQTLYILIRPIIVSIYHINKTRNREGRLLKSQRIPKHTCSEGETVPIHLYRMFGTVSEWVEFNAPPDTI